MKPSLFIVGEPKAGTTALFAFLEQHPDIFMPETKEPDYFCKDFHKESDNFHKKRRYFPFRTEKEYLGLFSNHKKEKIVGEASTHYLYSKVAAKGIYKFNPNAKIIIMLRNPVDFLYSLHSQYLYTSNENVKDFKTALSLEKNRKKGKDVPKRACCPSFLYYSERARFSEHIKRYYKLFNKDHIKVIIFVDFKKNNYKIYKEVLKFLNIKDFKPEIRKINPSKKKRWEKFAYLIESPIVWKVPKYIMPEKIYNKVKDSFYKIITKTKPRPKMDPKLKKELMKKYKPEVKKLSRLLNRDLIRLWGYDKIR